MPYVVLMNHSQDVGGGSVKNKTRYSLGRISLRWMVRECFKAKTGILFISVRLPDIGLDPSSMLDPAKHRAPLPVGSEPYQEPPSWIQRWIPRGEKGKPKEIPMVSEEDEDLKDALSPIYDQLKLKRWWWFVELLPLSLKHPHREDDAVLMRRQRILKHLPGSFKYQHEDDDNVKHWR